VAGPGWLVGTTLVSVPLIATVVGGVFSVIGVAFTWTVLTLLYLDLRHRDDGFDLAELERALEPLRSGQPTPALA
jgi:hypothetical protein